MAGTAWSLTLDLVAGGHNCGLLRMFRQYNARDLQLDINLLTSLFPTALAEALSRSLTPALQNAATSKREGASVMTAHVG